MKTSGYSKAALRKLIRPYLKFPGVHNIEIGEKYEGGKPLGRLAIRFHVDRKRSASGIPRHHRIPKKIGKFETDVIERRIEREARREDPRGMVRPLLGGIEIQNATLFDGETGAGTMGAFIFIEGVLYGLTNFHVVFGKRFSERDAAHYADAEIVQPCLLRRGTRIGRASLIFNALLDFALITFTDDVLCDTTQDVNCLNGIIGRHVMPGVGKKVIKSGAVTGITHGLVEGESLICSTISIRADPQYKGEPNISLPGDSGAVWFDASSAGILQPVGLHVGRDTSSDMVMASSFHAIHASIHSQLRKLIKSNEYEADSPFTRAAADRRLTHGAGLQL